jgi:predicted amidohydrolase
MEKRDHVRGRKLSCCFHRMPVDACSLPSASLCSKTASLRRKSMTRFRPAIAVRRIVALVTTTLSLAVTFLLAATLLVVFSAPASRADGTKLVVAAAQTELRFWQSAEDFAAHMASRVQAAVPYAPDIIAFPEDIGTPLVALEDYDIIAQADSITQAVQALAERHAPELGAVIAKHHVSAQRALWLIKADLIKKTYQDTFSALARRHKIYIAAGSTPMVFPERPAEVFNTACVFDPDGLMHVVGTKVNLVELEQASGLDFSPGSVESYKVFRTPKAIVGCIICADGWHPSIARALVHQGAQLLLQVSANPEVWTEDTRRGWQDSLFSRVQELKVYGVCVMGVGQLLGLPFQGQSAVFAPKEWTDDRSGIIAQAPGATDEAIVAATLDITRVAK